MTHITKTFYSVGDLVSHLKAHQPSFYFSSQTSTVIPYDKLDTLLPWSKGDFFLCDLSKMPPKMELKENGNLVLSGSVSWEDAKKFLRSKGRNLKTSPTEQLALITAGIATSCTGERCFGFGTMRSQVVSLKYLDFNGEEKILNREEEFVLSSEHLKQYQQDFKTYQTFKNAPYPRFEKAIDLMIGTEGQLGLAQMRALATPSKMWKARASAKKSVKCSANWPEVLSFDEPHDTPPRASHVSSRRLLPSARHSSFEAFRAAGCRSWISTITQPVIASLDASLSYWSSHNLS